MVIRLSPSARGRRAESQTNATLRSKGNVPRQRGALATDLMIALSIFTIVMLPVAFSIIHEQKLARIYYHQAIAMEIVDGEMEVLRAGEWRAFQPGVQAYPVRAEAAKNLPHGTFLLTLTSDRVRLEWLPDRKQEGGKLFREAPLK